MKHYIGEHKKEMDRIQWSKSTKTGEAIFYCAISFAIGFISCLIVQAF